MKKPKGIHWCPRNGRYQARVTVKGRRKHVGYFLTQKMAEEAVEKEKGKVTK